MARNIFFLKNIGELHFIKLKRQIGKDPTYNTQTKPELIGGVFS